MDDGGVHHAVVENDRQQLSDILSGDPLEPRRAVPVESEDDVGATILVGPLLRPGQVAACNRGHLIEQVPTAAIPRVLSRRQLRVGGQHAAVIGQGSLFGGIGPLQYDLELEQRRGLNDVPHARAVFHAGELNHQFVVVMLAIVGYHRLRQAQLVDAVLDRGPCLLERLVPDRRYLAGFQTYRQRHRFGRGVDGPARQVPVRELRADQALNVLRLVLGHSFNDDVGDVGLAAFGVGDTFRFELIPQTLLVLVGLHVDRIVHVNLQDQVHAAPEIKSQANAVADVRLQFLNISREADDSEQAREDHRANQNRAGLNLLFHGLSRGLSAAAYFLFFASASRPSSAV